MAGKGECWGEVYAPSLTGVREGSELGGEHWIPAGRVTHLGSQQQDLRTRAGFQWGGGAVPALYSQGTARSWASTGSSGTARDLVLPGGSPGAIRAIPLAQHKAPKTSMATK